MQAVKKAMDALSSLSCILFEPRTDQVAYIEFFKGTGCVYILTFRVIYPIFCFLG